MLETLVANPEAALDQKEAAQDLLRQCMYSGVIYSIDG